jgi:hypothetical protein
VDPLLTSKHLNNLSRHCPMHPKNRKYQGQKLPSGSTVN